VGALLLGNVNSSRDEATLYEHNIELIVQCAEEFSQGKPGAPSPANRAR